MNKEKKSEETRLLKVCAESQMNAPICHFISNSINSATIYKISKQESVPYICLKDK
jgi:hypothetical protein